MPDRSLDDWLKLLQSRHPVEIDLGLERVGQVAARLAIGAVAAKVVTVAGTNGKGSCVRTFEQLALSQGLRVATYSSPHLVRYNERIRIQGREVDDGQLCAAFAQIEAVQGNVSLTYFEVGTLAALLIMANSALDLAVLEVGLGGRYDAVNIIDGDLAVITPIAIDHAAWLGDSRELIAIEKAGIARAGRPLVCCDSEPPLSLRENLDTLRARPFYINEHFQGDCVGDLLHARFTLPSGATKQFCDLPIPALPLPSVLAAIQGMLILGYDVDSIALANTLSQLHLAGRYQRMQLANRLLILDVAHNPAAAAFLAKKLVAEKRRVIAVVAIMADKDAVGFARALRGAVSHWCLGDLAGNVRALPAVELARILDTLGCSYGCAQTLEDAFDQAVDMAENDDIIMVCGSFFTLAAIGNHIGRQDEL
ncbi:MAG: bifunctional tetrahydrofolate synthase/dihydrofolate synthase [Porticoccaceae bacterium]|nr:bifunctional tetrahydrofolate synthase/dihydrofolate synthase [Porticoccaceae bacterium]